MGYMKFFIQMIRCILYKFFIGITISSTQPEITMRQCKIHFTPRTQIDQYHAVNASAAGQKKSCFPKFWKFGFDMGFKCC